MHDSHFPSIRDNLPLFEDRRKGMADVVEFYIYCNPPLLPQGVSEVIRRVQDTESRSSVTTAVQDNLFVIADEDIDALDPDADYESPLADSDVDVSVISPDARMMPWAEHRRRSHTYADADVYPVLITEAHHKTAWRGLEYLHPDVTFAGLLAHAGHADEHRFAAETGCLVSYDVRQTVVYLGSDEGQERLDSAVERLESMTKQYVEHKERAPQLLPPLPIFPAAEWAAVVAAAASHDFFDDIPADIKASLPDSVVPWTDPFKNDESLI
ncbi:hypothetical protein ISF_03733 [Cordyceps fumosorosea ARSEF 2679]|uniref:Uncharacterized protein n=1 Tax=Cordyceps fumosorosea (strain ARSEF 2679) TaxID=1081104 RepID=A0A167ZIF8_CORFA|nr:hypothetical protein ISF_03733 [Cordyceps fumosorosea ARSEF 2679]OAA67557.1 hypothetical protein ISF_03733 [Cordyceps fumosorosea ARSEF 2679]